MDRREFIGGAVAACGLGGCAALRLEEPAPATCADRLDAWQWYTDHVTAETYEAYMRDGDTRGLKALEDLEAAFEKVLREVRATTVRGAPAVWSVYNMGYVVKTRACIFAIDLVHRRAPELAPLLDFALITHNHDDHWRRPFYEAMDGAGKTVISNFLDNYGVRDWRKDGGYTRDVTKNFLIGDTEIRTSSVDHNGYLVDFTTAFEVRVGDWLLYHTGDCGNAAKLRTTWGRPDLWLFFPGCGVAVGEAVRKIGAKRTVFGHFWELGHRQWRLSTPLIRAALEKAASAGTWAETPMWGERIA